MVPARCEQRYVSQLAREIDLVFRPRHIQPHRHHVGERNGGGVARKRGAETTVSARIERNKSVAPHGDSLSMSVGDELDCRGDDRRIGKGAPMASTDALDRPGRRLAQHKAAIDAAVKAGVRHVVYTSMPKPEDSPLLLAPDHAGTEAALAESALPGWTVLRNHWYFENLFMSLPQVLASGQWYSAAGDGRIAHIARDDLARAAATALAGTAEGKTTLTLSGGRAYTTAEIAALVSQTVGKPIQVVPVPVEGLVQGMVGAGLPEPLARVFASFDTNTAAGRVAEVNGDYRALTGVEPTTFEQWLAANKTALTGSTA